MLQKKGHLDILKWAVEEGCSWGTNTLHYLCKNGELEIIKWLYTKADFSVPALEKGTLDSCRYDAKRYGQFEIDRWLRTLCKECVDDPYDSYLDVVLNPDNVNIMGCQEPSHLLEGEKKHMNECARSKKPHSSVVLINGLRYID